MKQLPEGAVRQRGPVSPLKCHLDGGAGLWSEAARPSQPFEMSVGWGGWPLERQPTAQFLLQFIYRVEEERFRSCRIISLI